MGIFSKVLKGLGTLFGGLQTAQKGVSAGTQLMTDIGGIAGIPMPWAKTPAQQGGDLRDFMNNAYPGTNPWEQLGAGGGAGVHGTSIATKTQKELQGRQLASNERIARIQAGATTTAAAIQHGPQAVQGIDSFMRGGGVGDFQTPTTLAVTKLSHELANIDASTRNLLTAASKNLAEAALRGHEATIKEAYAQYSKALAEADLTGKLTKGKITSLANLGRWLFEQGQNFNSRNTPIEGSVPTKPGRNNTSQSFTDWLNSMFAQRP